ncbi:fructosamine kinase family protein [Aquipuribacter sp. MA13-13]|uniref:fructosamine kinase family protein n=1 Tax=Aquipuribacter sp. MA13-13 TaxID=3440840 RepID=UPI003EEBAA77
MSNGTRQRPGTGSGPPDGVDAVAAVAAAAGLRDDQVFVKRRVGAPPGYFAVEAAGLRWLAAAAGVAVVQPLSVTDDALVLPRLPEVTPTPQAAEQFGRGLARTHAAGADWLGVGPDGWTGDGYIGPLVLPRLPEVTPTPQAAEQFGRGLARTHAAGADRLGVGPDGWTGDGYIGPLVLPLRTGSVWSAWYAEFRLLPYLRSAHDVGAVTEQESATVSRLLDRLVAEPGLFGDPEPPARLHGDLWNGNVMWTQDGVVLVDPASHGGHRETDLAMLALFDLPHLSRVLRAYDEASPLAPGWQERVALHQVHPLLVHAALFGGGYGSHAAELAARYV